MYTETIIKLIGRRPVYRVEGNHPTHFEDFGNPRTRAALSEVPVIDRKDWQRAVDGFGEGELPEACY